MAVKKRAIQIVVSGDQLYDWFLARDGGGIARERTAATNGSPGGTWLLTDMIKETIAKRFRRGTPPKVTGPEDPGKVSPDDQEVLHSLLLCENFRDKKGGKTSPAWRVSDYLGYGGRSVEPAPVRRPVRADIIVMDDANRGFRDDEARWPAAIKNLKHTSWVLYKAARPLALGRLWEALGPKLDRTITVVNIDDLRSEGVLISRGISWEQTCAELAWALRSNPCLSSLSRCAAVVVLFPYAGAFIFDSRPRKRGDDPGPWCRISFDPTHLEGQWLDERKGDMTGGTSCLTAAITSELAANPKRPNLERAIRRGVAGARLLFDQGFTATRGVGGEVHLGFPIDAMAQTNDPGEELYPTISIPRPWSQSGNKEGEEPEYRPGWSLLEASGVEHLDKVAYQVAVRGVKKGLAGIPSVSFGALTTVDRSEIESYNSIRSLVADYLDSDITQPLSFAVFGPPGSGKSFGIKQMAKTMDPRIKKIEFNLSQLQDPAELNAAFHKVRDLVLEGKIPLVFWDEFDSAVKGQPLFWLKSFLMPMQDGAFLEGETEHPIGKCLFVFAGGTCRTYAAFCAQEDEEDKEGNKTNRFKGVKGTDFVSRLKGHLDVLGPNQREHEDGTLDHSDRFFRIRRSILLNSFLGRLARNLCGDDGTVRIDKRVLDAFLKISSYTHGARSMETIIKISSLGKVESFSQSCLPQPKQMRGHVDPAEFLRIVQRHKLTPEILEAMAREVHEVYRQGATGDVAEKTWEGLPEELRESNRAHVRHIADHLKDARCDIVPARGIINPLQLSEGLIEELSISEHDRWCRERAGDGWEKLSRAQIEKKAGGAGWTLGYPKVIPPAGRVSPCLVPWEELSEQIKDYDRMFIRNLPRTLAPSGYTIQARVAHRPSGEGLLSRPIRVGVCGHRHLQADSSLDRAINRAMDAIRNDAEREGRKVSYQVVSCLAEGADRLLAQGAIDRLSAQLKVPLPLAEDKYEAELSDDESRAEFSNLLERAVQVIVMPPVKLPAKSKKDAKNQAYRQAGEFVVNDADYLIALWDGLPARGIGGTAEVVEAARKRFGEESERRLIVINPEKFEGGAG